MGDTNAVGKIFLQFAQAPKNKRSAEFIKFMQGMQALKAGKNKAKE